MHGPLRYTPLFVDRGDSPMHGLLRDAPLLVDRGDSPMPGASIEGALVPVVISDWVISEHGR